MRPRTLRRRGRFYHRKRSHWRFNLALALIGVALAGFVVADMRAGAPGAGPAEDASKRIATPALATRARTAPAELGSTALAYTASAPVSALPRPGRTSVVAGLAPGRRVHGETHANRRDFDGAGARLGVSTVRGVMARSPVPRTLVPMVMRSPTRSEGCRTCADQVPF